MLVSNLDEYKIKELYAQKAEVDLIVGGEELTTSPDAPKLEFVSKLSEVIVNNSIIPKMKLSQGKVSYPGRKQVYRQTKNGKYISDIVALEGEKIYGKKLLYPVIKNGKQVAKLPKLEDISKYYRKEINKFEKRILSIDRKSVYNVKLSQGLKDLTKKTIKEIKNSHKIESY